MYKKFLIVLLSAFFLLACNKEEDDDLINPYVSSGSISFTCKGEYNGNSIDFSNSYSIYTNYFESGICDFYKTSKRLFLTRYSNDLTSSFSINMVFDSTNTTDNYNISSSFDLYLSMGNKQFLFIESSANLFGSTSTDEWSFSNISYNNKEKTIQGTFNFEDGDLVIEGEFNAQLYEIIE